MDPASKKPSARRTSAGSSATRYMQCDRGHKKVCESCQSATEDRKEGQSTSSRSLPRINTSEPQQRSSTARPLSQSNTSSRFSQNDTTQPPSRTDTSQPQRQSGTAKTLSRSNTTQSTRNDTTQPPSANPSKPWFNSPRLREKEEEYERKKKEGKRIDFLNQHAHLERSPSPIAAKETKTHTSQKSVGKKTLDEPPSKPPKIRDPLAEELFPEDEAPAPEIEKRHANELRPRPSPDYSTLKATERKVQPAEASDSGSPPVSAPRQKREQLFPEDDPSAPEVDKRHANELRPRPTPDYSTLKATKRKVQPAEGSDSDSPPVSAPWQKRVNGGGSNSLPAAYGRR